MSRDRQRLLEAEGSGFGSMENGAKSLGLGGGNQDQELPPEPASFSQVALLILDRAGGTFRGQPSCLQLRALPGLPSSQPCLHWALSPLDGSFSAWARGKPTLAVTRLTPRQYWAPWT